MYIGVIYQTNYKLPLIQDEQGIFHWILAPIIFIPSM